MSVAIDTRAAAPFLGLRYFDEEQAHLFFGRDLQINDVLEKLRRSRLVTVMGSSGSGKSSLVRAGVIPRLRAGLLGGAGPRWRVAKMRPGNSPIASLARELEKALSAEGLEVTLRRGPLGLVQAVAECRLPPGENVLVIADQFEEVFRYQRESRQPERAKEEAAAFVKLLLEATSERGYAIYVIVTMRSDYLGNCAQFRDLPERINEGLYLVPRLRRDQLEEAIAGPVAVEDTEITPRLLQKLLNETGDDPDQLPVLQHALLRAWSAWNGAPRPLDLQDLEAVGGMKEGLSRHADETFAKLSSEQQRIARVIFQQLSERDAEGREVRRPAPVAQIAAVAGVTEQAVDDVVETFTASDAAFLYRNEDGHLDITHESLIRKWSRIQGATLGRTDGKGWMQEEADARDEFLLLVERAAKNDTLMGRALDDATAWRALGLNAAWAARYTKVGGTNTYEDVLRFVDSCRAADAAHRRRRRRWWQIGVVSVVVVLVVITMFWRSAERQKAAADEAAKRAQVALARSSTQEAVRLIAENHPHEAFAHLGRALRLAPDDVPSQSWLADLVRLAREGTFFVSGPTLAHEAEVFSAVFSPDGRRIVTAANDGTAHVWEASTGQPVGPAVQLTGAFISVAFGPDGPRIVTGAEDGTARIWDVGRGQLIGAPLQHLDIVTSALFSPDGRRIVTTTLSGDTARVWDANTGQPVASLRHDGSVGCAVFSPDGRQIVTTSSDKARLWDVATWQPVSPPLQHQDNVSCALLSPDGRRLLTISDKTARVWDAGTAQPVSPPMQHQEFVESVDFSPDGRWIITASKDRTVRVWDAETGQPVGAPLRHESYVTSAVFSPDGRRIATASDDRTARVWDAGTGQSVGAPLRHQGYVFSAVFSPDGRRLLTASGDRTARLWDAGTGQMVGGALQHERFINSATFSPDGRRIVTASWDETARVWDAATRKPVGGPLQHDFYVTSALFSPDGRRIVTASYETARVWDAATGQPVGAPMEHQHIIRSAVFSPDGHRILTASQDNTARVWDAETGQPVGAPLQHESYVTSAVFSPDGRRIVTASTDRTTRVRDAATGQPVGVPLEHQGSINSAVFSPDGRQIATASDDRTVRVWDAATGQPVGAPLRHQDRVNSAVFSPDGRQIATASDDRTARVWDAGTRQPVGAPLQHKGPVNSAVFSSDGRRVVTASGDNTARVWDADTGQPLSGPLQHQSSVRSAVFSPDGRRLVTMASDDPMAHVWDVLLDSRDALLLADLAEVLGGYRVNELGSVVPLEQPARLQRISRLAGSEANRFVPLEGLLERFLPASR